MTTLQVTLSDDLEREAEAEGLLSAEAVADLLEQEIRRRHARGLLTIMEKLHAADDGPAMTAEEVRTLVEKEIQASRLENAHNS